MHLPRLLRTSIFRLTLLYAALFSASVLLLFSAIFWFGSGYVASQIDKTVSNEIEEVQTKLAENGIASLPSVVKSFAQEAPSGVYYLLEDKTGRVLAGNMPALDPLVGVRSLPSISQGQYLHQEGHGIRGRGLLVNGDDYLFVGLDNYELNEMREMIASAFLWGLAATIALALLGGLFMSMGLLRRVEIISRTSREIVAGDLDRRVPVRGVDDEFDHLALSLNTMLDRISGLMDGLRQVSSDIAHDLRTPLTRLRQRLEIARQRENSVDRLHEALDSSIQDVDAILETFAALLRIAQIEAHTKAVGFTDINLSAMLNEMLDIYQSVAEENGQRLSSRISAGLHGVGDRELLPQLFSNLIENSIRHCPAGAQILIEAAPAPNGIEITVSDNGPGIPVEFRTKVFERFFRVDSSRSTDGTGLGLSLVAAIATLHQVQVDLSDNNPGLRVRLVFPLASRA